jgi:hypothetical protein
MPQEIRARRSGPQEPANLYATPMRGRLVGDGWHMSRIRTLTDCDDRGCETTNNGEPRCALLTAPWRPPCSCSSSRRRLGTLTMRTADGPIPGSAAPRWTAGRSAQVGRSLIRYPLPAGGSCQMGPWCRSTSRALPPTAGSTCAGGAGNSQARSSRRTSAQHVYGSRPMANPTVVVVVATGRFFMELARNAQASRWRLVLVHWPLRTVESGVGLHGRQSALRHAARHQQ